MPNIDLLSGMGGVTDPWLLKEAGLFFLLSPFYFFIFLGTHLPHLFLWDPIWLKSWTILLFTFIKEFIICFYYWWHENSFTLHSTWIVWFLCARQCSLNEKYGSEWNQRSCCLSRIHSLRQETGNRLDTKN